MIEEEKQPARVIDDVGVLLQEPDENKWEGQPQFEAWGRLNAPGLHAISEGPSAEEREKDSWHQISQRAERAKDDVKSKSQRNDEEEKVGEVMAPAFLQEFYNDCSEPRPNKDHYVNDKLVYQGSQRKIKSQTNKSSLITKEEFVAKSSVAKKRFQALIRQPAVDEQNELIDVAGQNASSNSSIKSSSNEDADQA